MSNKYINDAIKQASSIKDPAAAHVLLILADHADPEGGCYLLHETLANETGRSVATVKRKLDVLKAQGRLQWTTIKNNPGNNVGNRYRLIPTIAQADPADSSPVSYGADPADSSSRSVDSSSSTKTTPQIAQNDPADSSLVSYRTLREPREEREPREPRERERASRAPPARAPELDLPGQPEAEAKPSKRLSEGSKGSKRTKAHALPETWAPSQSDEDYGKNLGFTNEQIRMKAEKLRRWAAANNAKKTDWSEYFKTWLVGDAERRTQYPARSGNGKSTSYMDIEAELIAGMTNGRGDSSTADFDLDLSPDEWKH